MRSERESVVILYYSELKSVFARPHMGLEALFEVLFEFPPGEGIVCFELGRVV